MSKKDTERLWFFYQYVRSALESDGALEKISLLVGDAPPWCNCREAHCPHERQFPPTIEDCRSAIDAARDAARGPEK